MIKIEWLGHSTVKLSGDKAIYIDPYNIQTNYNDADIIFITHSHYDHFSKDDIRKCIKNGTKMVVTEDLRDEVLDLDFAAEDILSVLPNEEYEISDMKFHTLLAYNNDKEYHPRTENWVGYILDIDGEKYYIAGDTDMTTESQKVKCDVAFLPVGGTYTMNYEEAAELANIIRPNTAIPIHYGTLVGTKEDALGFQAALDKGIDCIIFD